MVDWKLPDVNIIVKSYLGIALPNICFKSQNSSTADTRCSPLAIKCTTWTGQPHQVDSISIAITAILSFTNSSLPQWGESLAHLALKSTFAVAYAKYSEECRKVLVTASCTRLCMTGNERRVKFRLFTCISEKVILFLEIIFLETLWIILANITRMLLSLLESYWPRYCSTSATVTCPDERWWPLSLRCQIGMTGNSF